MRLRLFLVLVGVLIAGRPGLAGDGVVALQTAAPSCRNNSSNIYVNCGNGTVTDNRTGLVLLKNANCFGPMEFSTAFEVVAGLSDLPGSDPDDCGLSDGSSPGEWRIPSRGEWERMIDDALGIGGDPDCRPSPPLITNDGGGGCWVNGPSSFTGIVADRYWSSTSWSGDVTQVYFVHLFDTLPRFDVGFRTAALNYLWPVRGGQ